MNKLFGISSSSFNSVIVNWQFLLLLKHTIAFVCPLPGLILPHEIHMIRTNYLTLNSQDLQDDLSGFENKRHHFDGFYQGFFAFHSGFLIPSMNYVHVAITRRVQMQYYLIWINFFQVILTIFCFQKKCFFFQLKSKAELLSRVKYKSLKNFSL